MDTEVNNGSSEIRTIRLKLSVPGAERESPFFF